MRFVVAYFFNSAGNVSYFKHRNLETVPFSFITSEFCIYARRHYLKSLFYKNICMTALTKPPSCKQCKSILQILERKWDVVTFFFFFLWIDFAGAAGVEAGEAATAAEVRAAGTGSTRNGTASQPVSNCDVFLSFSY